MNLTCSPAGIYKEIIEVPFLIIKILIKRIIKIKKKDIYYPLYSSSC